MPRGRRFAEWGLDSPSCRRQSQTVAIERLIDKSLVDEEMAIEALPALRATGTDDADAAGERVSAVVSAQRSQPDRSRPSMPPGAK